MIKWTVSRNNCFCRLWPFRIMIVGRKVQIFDNNVSIMVRHFDCDLETKKKESLILLKNIVKRKISKNEKEYNKLCDIEDIL